jgi:subtilisin family serine protease
LIFKRFLAALVASTLLFASPAIANPGKGNSANTPAAANSAKPVVAPAPNTEVAQAKAEQAAAKASESVAKAEEKVEKAAEAKNEAAVAAQEKKAAEQEVSKLEEAAKSNTPAAAAAKEKLEEAKQKAAAAASTATVKEKTAAELALEAAKARANAAADSALAKVLTKIKGAEEACIEFVETKDKAAQEECVPSRYVVRFNAGVDPDLQVKGMKAIKIPVQATLKGVFPGAVADLNAGQLKALVASGKVRSVEQDFEVKLDPTTSDTQFNATWGLDRIDQVDLPLSGTFTNPTNGTGVRAYVVDTGVLTSHAEFAGRTAAGYTAISDGRGTTDCNGHGTHVAGTIAGTSYGVAKGATVIPVRVLDCAGSGYLSGVVAGLDWIGSNHPALQPAVVNMSLGGGASSTLDAAVESLVSKGITVAVAAGNSAADACNASPARTPNALTVAASNSTDGFASFSNFGKCVDLIAPGVGITSAWINSNTSTATLNGTSMATPHVAGLVAALMTNGYLAPYEVATVLGSSAAANKISAAPAGTPNLLAQLVVRTVSEPAPEVPTESATVPVAPVLTGFSTAKTAVRINWSISPDGGSPLLSHSVRVWERGQLVRKIDVAANATSHRVTGLKRGVSYTFTVVANNAIGISADSEATPAYTPR